MMGVSHVPINEELAGTTVAPGLFQFTNGINGSGPMGSSTLAVKKEDSTYSNKRLQLKDFY